MAKVAAPLFSLSASKSLRKTLTFQKRKAGSVVYGFKKPGDVSPFTPSGSQVTQRASFKSLIDDWNGLSPSEKAEWNEAAKEAGFIGTGFNYFISQGGEAGPSGDGLLLETGDYLLQETNNYILLE